MKIWRDSIRILGFAAFFALVGGVIHCLSCFAIGAWDNSIVYVEFGAVCGGILGWIWVGLSDGLSIWRIWRRALVVGLLCSAVGGVIYYKIDFTGPGSRKESDVIPHAAGGAFTWLLLGIFLVEFTYPFFPVKNIARTKRQQPDGDQRSAKDSPPGNL